MVKQALILKSALAIAISANMALAQTGNKYKERNPFIDKKMTEQTESGQMITFQISASKKNQSEFETKNLPPEQEQLAQQKKLAGAILTLNKLEKELKTDKISDISNWKGKIEDVNRTIKDGFAIVAGLEAKDDKLINTFMSAIAILKTGYKLKLEGIIVADELGKLGNIVKDGDRDSQMRGNLFEIMAAIDAAYLKDNKSIVKEALIMASGLTAKDDEQIKKITIIVDYLKTHQELKLDDIIGTNELDKFKEIAKDGDRNSQMRGKLIEIMVLVYADYLVKNTDMITSIGKNIEKYTGKDKLEEIGIASQLITALQKKEDDKNETEFNKIKYAEASAQVGLLIFNPLGKLETDVENSGESAAKIENAGELKTGAEEKGKQKESAEKIAKLEVNAENIALANVYINSIDKLFTTGSSYDREIVKAAAVKILETAEWQFNGYDALLKKKNRTPDEDKIMGSLLKLKEGKIESGALKRVHDILKSMPTQISRIDEDIGNMQIIMRPLQNDKEQIMTINTARDIYSVKISIIAGEGIEMNNGASGANAMTSQGTGAINNQGFVSRGEGKPILTMRPYDSDYQNFKLDFIAPQGINAYTAGGDKSQEFSSNFANGYFNQKTGGGLQPDFGSRVFETLDINELDAGLFKNPENLIWEEHEARRGQLVDQFSNYLKSGDLISAYHMLETTGSLANSIVNLLNSAKIVYTEAYYIGNVTLAFGSKKASDEIMRLAEGKQQTGGEKIWDYLYFNGVKIGSSILQQKTTEITFDDNGEIIRNETMKNTNELKGEIGLLVNIKDLPLLISPGVIYSENDKKLVPTIRLQQPINNILPVVLNDAYLEMRKGGMWNTDIGTTKLGIPVPLTKRKLGVGAGLLLYGTTDLQTKMQGYFSAEMNVFKNLNIGANINPAFLQNTTPYSDQQNILSAGAIMKFGDINLNVNVGGMFGPQAKKTNEPYVNIGLQMKL